MLELKSVLLLLIFAPWGQCRLKISVHDVKKKVVVESTDSVEEKLRKERYSPPDVIYASILGKQLKDRTNLFDEENAEIKVSSLKPMNSMMVEEDNLVQMHIPAKTSFFIVMTGRSNFDEIRAGDYIYFVSDTLPGVFDLGKINHMEKLTMDIETNLQNDLNLVEEYIYKKQRDSDVLEEHSGMDDITSWENSVEAAFYTPKEVNLISPEIRLEIENYLNDFIGLEKDPDTFEHVPRTDEGTPSTKSNSRCDFFRKTKR